MWEGALLLACGGLESQIPGRLKLLPEADLRAGSLANVH